MSKPLLFLVLACLTFPAMLQAQIYVSNTATGLNNGSSWTNAFTSLHDALSVASDGDEIWIKEGTYVPQKDSTGNFNPSNDRSKMFHVGSKHLLIYGGFAGTEVSIAQRDIENHPTILSGEVGGADSTDNLYTLLYFEYTGLNGNHTVDGLVFQQSNSSDFVGQLLAALTVREDVYVRNCKFLHNRGVRGGGMTSAANVQIDKSYFYKNMSSQQGGAYYAGGGQVALSNSTFLENASTYGGALKFEYASGNEISNCVFAHNYGISLGGAMQFYSTGVNLYNCTFFNNNSLQGHAIGVYGVYYARVSNSILWNSNNTQAIGNASGTNTEVKYSIINEVYSGTGNLQDPPLFKDTLNADFTPLSCSPAVNMGINDSVFVSEDLSGNPRIENGGVDMGALEYATPVLNNAGTNLFVTESGPVFQWVDCNNGFSAVPAETNSYFYPSVPGSYALVLFQGGCLDTTLCETIVTVGVEENQGQFFQVYPNPSSGVIHLQNPSQQMVQVDVLDALGRIVSTSYNNNGLLVMTLPEPKGIYFIRIIHASGAEIHQVVRD